MTKIIYIYIFLLLPEYNKNEVLIEIAILYV